MGVFDLGVFRSPYLIVVAVRTGARVSGVGLQAHRVWVQRRMPEQIAMFVKVL